MDPIKIDAVKFEAGGSDDMAAANLKRKEPEHKTYLSHPATGYSAAFFNNPPIDFNSK